MSRTSVCSDCRGTGTVIEGLPGSGTVCQSCMGSKVRVTDPSGAMYDIMKAVEIFSNLSPTCKIGNCIDGGEWGALSAGEIAGVERVLACGLVDTREGEWARVSLWSIFGEASLTRAALITMFG